MHSPFVYDLLTKCVYKKEKKPAFDKILAYRKALLNDYREIEVKDFGAGSKVFKSNKRKVSAIAKNAGISKKRAILLNKLCSYLKIKSALELGTSVGISSAAIAAGNDLQLLTLEGCPQTAGVAKEYFEKFALKNIEVEIGSFEEKLRGQWNLPAEAGVDRGQSDWERVGIQNLQQALQTKKNKPQKISGQWTVDSGQSGRERVGIQNLQQKLQTPNHKPQTPNHKPQTTENRKPKTENGVNQQLTTENPQPKTDFIFFDGNHQKEATLKYFNQLLPLAHNDSVFIFDDIHWSKGMEEAWEEIKDHPNVRVTIDSFYWGIVFFRKEQEKEHFVIRL